MRVHAALSVLPFVVVNEDHVCGDAAQVIATFGLGAVLELWVCGVPNQSGDLWSHTVLRGERSMDHATLDESLEQGDVEIVGRARTCNFQLVMLQLGPQLLVVTDQNKMLGAPMKVRKCMCLKDFTSFFHDGHLHADIFEQISVHGGSGSCAADDAFALQHNPLASFSQIHQVKLQPI